MTTFYKIFAHNYASPIQGGVPIWDGTLPFTLPAVKLDTSEQECSSGWNFVEDLAAGFNIARFWPTGRPSIPVVVEPSSDWIRRGDKCRASSLQLVRLASEEETSAAIERFSMIFGTHAGFMADEQRRWRSALARPQRDAAAVARALAVALEARGLKWALKEYTAAWDARAARAAWAALTVAFASVNEWTKDPKDLLSVGLRDAYAAGLEIAIPVAKDTLGWAMAA